MRPGAGQPLCSDALGAPSTGVRSGGAAGTTSETDPRKFLELRIVLETCPGTA